MHSVAELTVKWSARLEEWRRLGVSVNGAAIADEVLADLHAIDQANLGAVTLAEASRLGGYSVDHLQRLVAAGQLDNIGRKGRPRIRRADVPVKPGYLRPDAETNDISARRRIVASVTGAEAS